MNKPAVKVENLSKRYNLGELHRQTNSFRDKVMTLFKKDGRSKKEETIWALKDISFEVKQGEILGIIGPNGAGKSTLLKILSRITKPTKGYAFINGRLGSLLEVGTGFHPELTGRENIYLNGAILGMKKVEIEKKFDDMVAFAEIDKFIDTPVKRYSSGMYVRLAFAVAAHLEPNILLIDEVLAVGDAAFQKKCLGKMDEVSKEGRTVLFVSHNMLAVQNLCTRVIYLHSGQIIKQGDTSVVLASYFQNSHSNLTEQIWNNISDAPGNDQVRIHRVSIHPENGKTKDQIIMSTPLLVEIDLWNLVDNLKLDTTLHFSNEQGIIAFATSSLQQNETNEKLHKKPGVFRYICHIPGNLLNSGMLRIHLFVLSEESKVILKIPNILAFDIYEAVNSNRAKGWYGARPGVVRPLLHWKVKHIDNS